MKTAFKHAIALLILYLISWTVTYIWMFNSRGDTLEFKYYIPYLVAAWTGHAGELPGFIMMFSLFLYVPVVIVYFYVARKRRTAISS